MSSALIGHTGLVGTTLLRQRNFDDGYRSTNIESCAGRHYDLVICAGAPAEKWRANQHPQADRASIDRLIRALGHLKADRFVLISTVDVFRVPLGVTETSRVNTAALHPYGAHRHLLEQFVVQRFAGAVAVRLPGLVGPGLKKNIIYDLVHERNVGKIDGRCVYQFYPMVNLWSDLQRVLTSDLPLVHLTAQPVSVATLGEQALGTPVGNKTAGVFATYDVKTNHSSVFGAQGDYQYSQESTFLATRAYAQAVRMYNEKTSREAA